MAHERTEGEIDARKLVHEAVQATNSSSEDLEGAVLTGWLLVSEWSDVEGKRWLSKLSGSAGGESSPPRWQAEGYLFNVLHSWPEDD